MAIRCGEEYLESLRDGRSLWLMGEKVEDVTTHPALAGCARSVAAVYDLQHDPAYHDLLTIPLLHLLLSDTVINIGEGKVIGSRKQSDMGVWRRRRQR